MRLVVLNGVLLAAIALAIVGTEALDRPQAGVEASVRRYAAAVSNADLDAAMAEIAPDQRATWSDWVQGQLGNVYVVTGIAVRSPSLLDRLTQHVAGGPSEVTTLMDVNPDYPDEFYQPTARVAIEQFDGRWYLAAPLLSGQ